MAVTWNLNPDSECYVGWSEFSWILTGCTRPSLNVLQQLPSPQNEHSCQGHINCVSPPHQQKAFHMLTSGGIHFSKSSFFHQGGTELKTTSYLGITCSPCTYGKARGFLYRQEFVVYTSSVTSCVKLYKIWLFVSSSLTPLRMLLIRPGITDFIMESCRWGVWHQRGNNLYLC